MNKTTEILREKSKKLLTGDEVKVIIGYADTRNGGTAPVFITDPDDCDQLVFDERCFANLSRYLYKPEVKELGKAAIVSKGCDNRAINVLIKEGRIKRDDFHVIGVECTGMDKAVCLWCDQHVPVDYDDLIEAETHAPKPEPLKDPLQGMTQEQKWEYWQGEFARCIKCYACRQVCPVCHCVRCMAEKNQPQWIDSSPHPRGNLQWNLVRAFHLAGRCVECGECERACPMDIPLSSISRSMKELINDKFAFVPGMDSETPAPLASFKEDDQEDFFE